MKFKKNITAFFCFISLFVFIFGFSDNLLVNAAVFLDYEFTHGYYNPSRDLISINASTKFFYDSLYNSADFSLPNTIRIMVGKIGYTSSSDLFRQYIFNFDYYEIKEYNNNIYIYIPLVNYETDNCSHNVPKDTYDSTSMYGYYGFTSKGNKALIKINPDFSSVKIAAFNKFEKTVSVDDFIMDDLEGSIGYFERLDLFNVFYEYQSTFNIKGETFQNNADIENPSYNGTVLSDKKKFIDWIIDNEKYVVFSDYGIENTAQFVDDIVNLYEQFNKNPLSLFVNFPQFLIKNGSIFATVDKAKELINYVSALYQEFKLERRPVIYEPELHPYIFPQPWVDDEPNEKYVDNVQDTVEIGLLREILRAIIVTPQNIFNFFDYYMYNISVNTSLLADYVAQLPQYLADLIYNNFFEDINYIKNALDNLPSGSGGGSDLINVEITTEKETEINTFFNDWNITFNNKINEKIPIIPQLHTLFFTFWEQTNVIKNENELPVYNYNQFLNDSDALTAITGVFDNSNKDYLTNINSPFIPSLTIRIGGVSHEIINFKFYAKYRRWIHNLITFILWFSFLLSLYKSIPNIIGRVAGLDKFIDTKNEGVKDDSIVDSYYISDRKD